jgi:dTDP-4-dehydrorhamnose reductase
MDRLQQLGIAPIAGLVHHGSGPRWTSLTEPSFATGLAEYAGAVAARYPWVRDWTPVNEPLTTARFSGLYGHWYPHGRDDRTFVRTLLTQCRATLLAMEAVRAVNPAARLIQTEDLGRTSSTRILRYQARVENERRWLSIDLLCGRVDRSHRLWRYLRDSGASAAELEWFQAHACPPDVLGFNHYLTSERFLDHRLDRYPAHTHGSNGRHDYADVESVRVEEATFAEPRRLLREAWQRFRLPLAITEAHLAGTPDDQVRWLVEKWQAAHSLRASGVDIRAVAVWSVFGSFDWNCLVTRIGSFYEPGIFDVRSGTPRPTPLAGMVQQLAANQEPQHPALAQPGWWRTPERVLYPRHVASPIRAEQSYPRTVAAARD